MSCNIKTLGYFQNENHSYEIILGEQTFSKLKIFQNNLLSPRKLAEQFGYQQKIWAINMRILNILKDLVFKFQSISSPTNATQFFYVPNIPNLNLQVVTRHFPSLSATVCSNPESTFSPRVRVAMSHHHRERLILEGGVQG